MGGKLHKSSITIHRTYNEQLIIDMHKLIFPADDFHTSTNNKYWIAKHYDTPVAFCIGTICEGNVLFLCRAGVIDSFQGLGLHRRLIRVRESYAARYGINSIVTYASRYNHKSWITLIKMGYKVYEPAYFWGTKSAVYFQKKLKLKLIKEGDERPQ